MAPGTVPFRVRAASLLHPFTGTKPADDAPSEKSSRSRRASTEPCVNEKTPAGEQGQDGSLSTSVVVGGDIENSEGTAVAHDRTAHGIVRSVPAWVQTLDEDDEDTGATSYLLPTGPPTAQVAQHNHSPAVKSKGKPEPGRLHDAQREWTPPMPSVPTDEGTSRWRAFANASSYPAVSENGGMIVDEGWLVENGPDYTQPWLAGAGETDADFDGVHFWKSKQKGWWRRAHHTVLRNPMIPLAFRSIVWIFSLIALALASSIVHETHKQQRDGDSERQLTTTPSTKIAIGVDAVALIYILYITYDEYTGKPLGLRSARAKLRLLFLDLVFIVFDSANLSLAFEGLVADSDGACSQDAGGDGEVVVCHRQQALASVLLIALIAWLLTFSTSVLRVVERVNQR